MTLSPIRRTSLLIAGILVLGLGLSGFSGTALAQSSTGTQSPAAKIPKETVKKLKAKQLKIRQITSELREAEKKATASDPKLQDKQEKYRDLVMETMKAEDFDPKAAMQSIRSLQTDLQSNDDSLDTQQRQSKLQALRQKKQEFRKRQQQAMQVDEVKAARESLSKDMRSAMEEQDPGFEEKVAQLNELRQEYRSLLRKVLMQRQGGDQTPQG